MNKKTILILGLVFVLLTPTMSYATPTPPHNYVDKYITDKARSGPFYGLHGTATVASWLYANVDSDIFERFILPLGNDIEELQNKVNTLQQENQFLTNSLNEIKTLKERITLLEGKQNNTISTPTPANVDLGVKVIKKYVRYKNSVDVYRVIDGYHVGWSEAMTYNIWNDIQDLPYTKPLN